MKKNKQTKTQRKAAIKRSQKRADRLKRTKEENKLNKTKLQIDKKIKEQKIQEQISNLLKGRVGK